MMQNQYNADSSDNSNPAFLKRAITYMVNSYVNSNLISKKQAVAVLENLVREFYNSSS
jgi:hypothetical protein